MKILGLDYGDKRIGIAVSDESQTFARELSILSPKEFWKSIRDLILEHEIETIVLGMPLNMSGQATEKTREVGIFKTRLESQVSTKVEVMDERLSSQMAEHISGRKNNIDSLAAQIFLQNWLDRRKSK